MEMRVPHLLLVVVFVAALFTAMASDAGPRACMRPGVEITAEEAVARMRREILSVAPGAVPVHVTTYEFSTMYCLRSAGPAVERPHDRVVGDGLSAAWTVTFQAPDGSCLAMQVRHDGITDVEALCLAGEPTADPIRPRVWPHDIVSMLTTESDRQVLMDAPVVWTGSGSSWAVQSFAGTSTYERYNFDAWTGELEWRLAREGGVEDCDATGCTPRPGSG